MALTPSAPGVDADEIFSIEDDYGEICMKVTLRVHKDGAALHEGIYDVSDAESFGRACAHVWTQLREKQLANASSIGALFDALDERLLDELYGAKISLSKA